MGINEYGVLNTKKIIVRIDKKYLNNKVSNINGNKKAINSEIGKQS